MKANNRTVEPVDSVNSNKEVIEQGKPLIKVDELKVNFTHLTDKIEKYKEYADKLSIDSEDTLVVATNNIGLINETLKNIDKVRKTLKDPYLQTGKMIDAYSATLIRPLNEAKLAITEVITNYKKIQSAVAKVEANKIKEKAETSADGKAKEADKIYRIEAQIIARMYGGHWFNKENQRKTSAGCITPFECDTLKKIIKEKLPDPDTFGFMQDEYKKMLRDIQKKLSMHTSNLIESESKSETIKDNALKEINKAKEDASTAINQKKEETTQEIIKDARDEIKAAEQTTKEAGKGVRKTLVFELVKIEDVPFDWLQLNETAVRKWATENKGELKERMKAGENIITGIKFQLEEKYVGR